MRFGEETSPRIYAWGNPGVAATSVAHNATLAAGRVTEGGKFFRNQVPMFDSSTTEPVVRKVFWPEIERDKARFKSLAFVSIEYDTVEGVVAVDHSGQMHAWGRSHGLWYVNAAYDPIGMGGQRVRSSLPQASITRPIRVLRPEERESGVTNTWTKVQAKACSPCVVALDQAGTLYASGLIPPKYFLDEHKTANVSATCFSQISTQSWTDFATFGESLLAIRNDGTLHEKGIGLSLWRINSTASSTQVKGAVIEAHASSYFLPPGTNSSLATSLQTPPAGGRQAVVRTAINTSTGEARRYLEDAGWGYTSISVVSTSRTPATAATPPALNLRLAKDTAWHAVYSNGYDAAIAVNRDVSVTDEYATIQISTPALLPDNEFFKTYSSIQPYVMQSLAYPMTLSVDGNSEQSSVRNVSWRDISLSQVPSQFDTARNFALVGNDLRTGNRTNVLSWGTNRNGSLAVGHETTQAIIRRSLCHTLTTATYGITYSKISLSSDHSLAIGLQDAQQRPTEGYGKLYCAGKFQFAGSSSATANITSLTPVTPASANAVGNVWYSCHAYSDQTAQLSVASLGENTYAQIRGQAY